MMEGRASTRARPAHAGAWIRIFFGGLVLWIAAVIVTLITRNSNLVPTVILLGSFLVPVTFVTYAFEHRISDDLTEQTIFVGFVYGGVLGVLGATVLESIFIHHQTLGSFLGVGVIEEGCKLAVVWWLARRLSSYVMADGVVLGATVGFGFAAFETAGYAFNALFTTQGISLGSLVETEVMRGILTPVGHGLWTGILGGVLFHAARGGRLHLNRSLVVWFFVVSGLHAFWDAAGGLAAFIVFFLTATGWQVQLLSEGRLPQPTDEQVQLFTIVSWSFLAIDAIVGLVLLLIVWRHAVHAHGRL